MYAVLIPIVAMFIPIVAIVGGITVAIFRTHGQQKIAELAMRERIAAIERGLDPATLPPLPTVADPAERSAARSPRERALETGQGLRIGGLVTLGAGLGLVALFFLIPEAREHTLWAIGAVPSLVGVSLLASGEVVLRGAPPATPPGAAVTTSR
jgi:hypothetical protein